MDLHRLPANRLLAQSIASRDGLRSRRQRRALQQVLQHLPHARSVTAGSILGACCASSWTQTKSDMQPESPGNPLPVSATTSPPHRQNGLGGDVAEANVMPIAAIRPPTNSYSAASLASARVLLRWSVDIAQAVMLATRLWVLAHPSFSGREAHRGTCAVGSSRMSAQSSPTTARHRPSGDAADSVRRNRPTTDELPSAIHTGRGCRHDAGQPCLRT